jgi:hypothetical protein
MRNFYENTEVISSMTGGKTVRHVKIKGRNGYKSVTKYRGNKKISTKKKRISNKHINMIKKGIFIPGLFTDCKTKKCN